MIKWGLMSAWQNWALVFFSIVFVFILLNVFSFHKCNCNEG